MTDRHVHLVGTVPADDAKAALELFATELGDRLPPWVPDGETGARLNWIQRIIEGLRHHPDLRLARDGDWSDYEKTPYFTVAPRRSFTTLDLDYFEYFQESWPAFEAFRDSLDRPVSLQVGIPGHLDLALGAFGFKPAAAFRNVAPFRDATVREITLIQATAGDDVVFQLEIPIPLILLTRIPSRVRPLAAGRLAAELLKVVRRTRKGTRFGVHLCYGDMNHRSMADPEDTRPAVLLANALVEAWPEAQKLEFVHVPFGRGIEPPPIDGEFYAALAELRLPPEVRFAAGIVHEGRELDELEHLRNRIETLVGRPVDIAAACGLGRRDRQRAVQNLALSRALAE
ncbi:MAG TPA: hypothetical protein VF377_00410 [Acidimicrobiia bacterium]|jgi:hypothetical protein